MTLFISLVIGAWLSNMKKKTVFAALITLVSSTIVAVMSASLAWFTSKITISTADKVGASTLGAYFAYGDGGAADDPDTEIKEGPFGIETPRHLYNLAWLQYLGHFNKVEEGVITPVHFELNANIDMTGWALPPIGTTTNPFIGEFNGNGYTISNLVVTNNYDEIVNTNKIPSQVKAKGATNYTGVNIVGMFGVVGNYNNVITATYDSSVTSVRDFTIDGATIKNSLSNTLIGIAAGYVNGPLEDVGIVSSTLNLNNSAKLTGFDNISDYGVIGYCEDDYKGSLDTTVNEAYNVTANNYYYIEPNEGDDAGWGGSIDMLTMYNGILDVWKTYRTTSSGIPQYYSTRTIVQDENGNVTSDNYGGLTNIPDVNTWSSGNRYMRYFQAEQKNGSGQVTSSYTFAHRHAQNSNTRTDNYMYLYGDETNTVNNGTTVTTTRYGYKIRSGNNYLQRNNNTTVNNTTNPGANANWFWDGSYLYVLNNDTKYYLRDNSGTLALNTTKYTTWAWDSTHNTLKTTSGTTRYLTISGTTWSLTTTATLVGYKISSGSNYLSNSGTSLTNATNANNATTWLYDGTHYYVTVNNAKYYIYSGNNNPELSTSTNHAYIRSDNTLQSTGWNGTYYLYYSNGWTETQTKRNATLTFTETAVTPTSEIDFGLTMTVINSNPYTYNTTRESPTYTTKPTYFPLRQNETNGIPNGTPKDSNTGYVISGGNDTTGDIRVSEYASSSLTDGLSKIYTYNNSGTVRIDSTGGTTYQRYTDSVNGLQEVFDSDTAHIYGLHFVGATVSYAAGGGSSVYAESATVNGTTYTNYELPRDCIDFNLREKGYINFLAGTYFSGSDNCFFSVHDIFRDGNGAITNIKEIIEVYASDSETNSYVYKYSDGKYSVAWKYKDGQKVLVSNENTPYTEGSITNSLESGYNSTPVFKTSWIKKNTLTQNVAYYFEIPMNPGEYCLSSVANTNGAYLMYLDIGANAQKIFRGEMIEYFKFTTETYTYPKGVGIILAAGNSVSDKNSYCVCLKDSYNGTLTMEKVQNGDVEEGKYTGTGNADKEALSYKFPNVVVKDENGTAKTVAPTNTTTSEIKRLTYFDYNGAADSVTKIIITDTTVNGTTTRTIEKYKYFNLTTNTGTADSTIKIFYVSGVDTIDVTNSTNQIVFNTNGNTTSILVFNSYQPDGSTLTITFMLNVAKSVDNEGNTIFTPNGYKVTITLTAGSGQSTDITAECYVTKVLNSDGTYTYTITINGNTPVAGGDPIVINVGA